MTELILKNRSAISNGQTGSREGYMVKIQTGMSPGVLKTVSGQINRNGGKNTIEEHNVNDFIMHMKLAMGRQDNNRHALLQMDST
jgi:hypothetical protein